MWIVREKLPCVRNTTFICTHRSNRSCSSLLWPRLYFIKITIYHMWATIVNLYFCELCGSVYLSAECAHGCQPHETTISQAALEVAAAVVVVITFHSEMKCPLKCSSSWIEFQECLEQNECSRCTETHSGTESSASPWGRAIALGRPPGRLAWLKPRDPNSTPVNLKNTRPPFDVRAWDQAPPSLHLCDW